MLFICRVLVLQLLHRRRADVQRGRVVRGEQAAFRLGSEQVPLQTLADLLGQVGEIDMMFDFDTFSRSPISSSERPDFRDVLVSTFNTFR